MSGGELAYAATGHPYRVRILGAIEDDQEVTTKIIAAALGVDRGEISYHVGVLVDAGLLEDLGPRPAPRRRGRPERFYRRNPAKISEAQVELDELRGDLR